MIPPQVAGQMDSLLAGARVKPGRLTPANRRRLERVEGVVFDVQRYSLHDGPGLRTAIFFKGCPLRCAWCANPESQTLQPELALFAQHCIQCGMFEDACPDNWTEGERLRTSKVRAGFLEGRAAECPTAALRWIGEVRSAADLLEEVRRDIPFYTGGGGLTLTGGEPTLQPDLCLALLRLAQADGISTALETCGHTSWVSLVRILPYLDEVLFDLKHVDSAVHQAWTGQENELILSNLQRLAALGVPITLRVPLIPGFNATSEGVQAIAELALGLGNSLKGVDLLPYHTLGKAKYSALGRAYSWESYDRLTEEQVADLARIVRSNGLSVHVGG